jgi:DNA repair photolyase
MFVDRKERIVSYHDTWISLDPVRGCPYSCSYCVLRHAGATGVRARVAAEPDICVEQLVTHPLFVLGYTTIAIGNETDMFHPGNTGYLLRLLNEFATRCITNPVVLITKAPLQPRTLEQIKSIPQNRVVFFLSYSGLDQKLEPNFTDAALRANFHLAKSHGFSVVHYWRPLLPENSTKEAVERMLSFVSNIADASVLIGMKLHPELTQVVTADGLLGIPPELYQRTGEWLPAETVSRIYSQATEICPAYPLYRHSSCALAFVLSRPDHTGTYHRKDICVPSHCPNSQRLVCSSNSACPSRAKISEVLSRINRTLPFTCSDECIVIDGDVSQEEFAYLLHNLRFPIRPTSVKMQNLYHGSIYENVSKS